MGRVLGVRGSPKAGDGWLHGGAFVRSGPQKGREDGVHRGAGLLGSLGSEGGRSLHLGASHIAFLYKMGIMIPDNESQFLGFQVSWCGVEISLGRRAEVPGLES